jgi:uridine phosphorylase
MTPRTQQEWRAAMGLADPELPAAVICEGTWWRERQTALRLSTLTEVRELDFPDMWWGRMPDGTPVAYCCAYGAPRVVEPVHALGAAGTALAIQIGSCGGLQPEVRTGDLVLPEEATIRESTSPAYGTTGRSHATGELVDAAAAALLARGLTVHRGSLLTTSALLARTSAEVEAWSVAGHLAVDMETSALFSAAAAFGMAAVSLLYVWDELLDGRSWMDPLPPDVERRRLAADAATYDVALELAARGPGIRG